MKPTTTLIVVMVVGIVSVCDHIEARRKAKTWSWDGIADFGIELTQTASQGLVNVGEYVADGTQHLAIEVGQCLEKGVEELEVVYEELSEITVDLAEQVQESFQETLDSNEDLIRDVKNTVEDSAEVVGKFAHDTVYLLAKKEFEKAQKRFENFVDEAGKINDFDDAVKLLTPLVKEAGKYGACSGVCYGASLALIASPDGGFLTQTALSVVCNHICSYIAKELEEEEKNGKKKKKDKN